MPELLLDYVAKYAALEVAQHLRAWVGVVEAHHRRQEHRLARRQDADEGGDVVDARGRSHLLATVSGAVQALSDANAYEDYVDGRQRRARAGDD